MHTPVGGMLVGEYTQTWAAGPHPKLQGLHPASVGMVLPRLPAPDPVGEAGAIRWELTWPWRLRPGGPQSRPKIPGDQCGFPCTEQVANSGLGSVSPGLGAPWGCEWSLVST